MENETEVIKQQMADTRTALSEKLEAVEELVTSTVKDTTQTVTDTVAAVSSTVENTVSNVSETVSDSVESVREALDISTYVEKYPWLVMGGAVALGYTLGSVLGSTDSSYSASTSQRSEALPPASSGAAPMKEQPSSKEESSSFLEGWQPLIDKFKGLALGTTASLVGEMLVNAVPDNLKSHVSEMIDDATKALGGTNVRQE
jgi:ElaB/YqjD/DUF883 family membrane-anchored ribosome-binding protein